MKRLAAFFVLILLYFSMSSFASFDFSELVMDYSGIPETEKFTACDGEQLDYRFYPSSSDKLIILIHGSGLSNRYFFKLAKTLSEEGVAQVLTPDLRGHGADPKKRGDIDYIGQFDDDLLDLIEFARGKYSPGKIFLGGHSSGAGLTLRFAGSKYQDLVDGFVFLAPFFKHDAPMVRQDSGFADAKVMWIIWVSLMNALNIHAFDHVVTTSFNIPAEYRDGTESLKYTYASMISTTSGYYQKDFESINKPALLLVGDKDEAMTASGFEAIIPKKDTFELNIISVISHMGIVVNDRAIQAMAAWIKKN